jgi:hypothetical protein
MVMDCRRPTYLFRHVGDDVHPDHAFGLSTTGGVDLRSRLELNHRTLWGPDLWGPDLWQKRLKRDYQVKRFLTLTEWLVREEFWLVYEQTGEDHRDCVVVPMLLGVSHFIIL